MTRTNVQHVIDRILQDEPFRQAFLANKAAHLRELRESGVELSESDCERLRTTNWTLWLKLVECCPSIPAR